MAVKRQKSTIMTPDPYHTPGYCGYVPQFKYQIGETFGSHTHKLLTDPRVLGSGAILSETYPPPAWSAPPTSPAWGAGLVHRRTKSLGDQKYVPQMVPGYTGHVPKCFHEFGHRYAKACHSAISNFEEDQQRLETLNEEMRTLTQTQRDPKAPLGPQPPHYTLPLQPLAAKAKTYLSPYVAKHYSSPFLMPDDHPNKCFVSGYTGFVPKSRKLLGEGYPIITRRALQEHGAEEQRLAAALREPVRVLRPEEALPPSCVLYQKESGLIPHYTGHVPGEKFRFGRTFGNSTRNAMPQVSC